MIGFREVHIPRVSHVGALDRDPAELCPSDDGPALAVSDCPALWRRYIGSNAPAITLFCSNALWVDGFSLDHDAQDALRRWACMMGYARPTAVWRATRVDLEDGAFRESQHATAEAARHAAAPQGAVFEDDGLTLTPRALARLGRWQDPFAWFAGSLILYTREVIIPKRPLICGIWWRDAVDEAAKSAPMGQLLPEGLERFDVEAETGEMIPLRTACPDLRPMGVRPAAGLVV